MTTRIIELKQDIRDLATLLENMKLPLTVSITKGKNVTYAQHKLENLWHREASEQLQQETPEELRGYCKLHFGVSILRAENDKFREAYDIVLRPLQYEDKIRLMMVPLDYAVTRLMTTAQKTRYLEAVHNHYLSQGVLLTEPDSER
ncbi:MAG: hypothetical protein BMS9Abin02_2133 [Anaerolineae bacterium]|nr:MAG: hypothetical protein BMS9Abin02_2133 [Anaerolineae bacterium]